MVYCLQIGPFVPLFCPVCVIITGLVQAEAVTALNGRAGGAVMS